MFKLNPNELEKTRLLFAALIPYHLAVESILAGLSPAIVYVDDAAEPETAVTRINHRLFLGGKPAVTPELTALLTETIPAQSRAEERDSFIVYAAPEWDAIMDGLFGGKQPIRRQRQYLELDGRQFANQSNLSDGYRLHPVDAALLSQTHLQKLAGMKEEMVSERPSIVDFLAKSFGCCVIHKDEIVGWCMSEYNCGPRCEIGIATDPAHQRKGLALATATAVIQHARTQGIHQIGWHCWTDNAPSSAVARKLGFRLIEVTIAYPFFFDDVIHLGVQGNLCFMAQDYGQAADWYEQAGKVDNAPIWLHWNAACANVYVGRETAVFHHLNQAIAAGFDDWERLHNAPHLDPIRETAVWQTFIRQVP